MTEISVASSSKLSWTKLRWYHGVIFYIIINVLSGSWLATGEYLNKVGRPPFIPPDWAFGPAWTVNLFLMISAGLRLAQKPDDTIGKSRLIVIQTVIWFLFLSFSWVYFGLHSPILGFMVTLGMWIANVINLENGFPVDKQYGFAFVPLMIWLSFATAIAGWQMIYTPDELFGTSPILSR
jgi:tryptophan-rich sensory protein